MPVILAQQIEALNKTLEALENIGQVESIPGALLIMGVLMFLAIVIVSIINWRVTSAQLKSFERYSNAQQQSADTAQSNYIVERDITNAKVDMLVTQTQGIAQVVEKLPDQMAQIAQYLSKTADALKTLELRVIAGEAQTLDYWEKVELVGKELKANMNDMQSEVTNGNKEILEELRSIRAELTRVADSIEVTLRKLTESHDAPLDKPKPVKPEENKE